MPVAKTASASTNTIGYTHVNDHADDAWSAVALVGVDGGGDWSGTSHLGGSDVWVWRSAAAARNSAGAARTSGRTNHSRCPLYETSETAVNFRLERRCRPRRHPGGAGARGGRRWALLPQQPRPPPRRERHAWRPGCAGWR